MQNFTRLSLIALMIFCCAITASAATFVVNTSADTQDIIPGNGTCADADGNCSLRAAISEANSLPGADTITLPAGVYTQSLSAANDDANAGGDWDIAGDLAINGDDAENTVVQAAAAPGTANERVFDIRSGTVTLNDLTVRNGHFSGSSANLRGGGIENLGSLTLDHCVVTDNRLTPGNGIGAGIYNGGPALTLENTSVVSNINTSPLGAGNFGVGVSSMAAATIVINNSNISSNAENGSPFSSAGIGLYVENAFDLTITDSHFDNNSSTNSAANNANGIGMRTACNTGNPCTLNVTNTTFSRNSVSGALGGNGIGAQIGTIGSVLNATFEHVTIDGNTGNTRAGAGLDISLNGGPINIDFRNGAITNNGSAARGGGVSIARGSNSMTGAIINFTNTTISGNSSFNSGGGVYVEQFASDLLQVNFNFVTIANNTAPPRGGGLYKDSGTVVLKNSIVSGNHSNVAPDISGKLNSEGYNQFGSVSGASLTGGRRFDIIAPVLLGLLRDNGGGTLTQVPAGDSPAVDSIPFGHSGCGVDIFSDQRGMTRPLNDACDRGAVELLPLPLGPWNLSGIVTDDGGRPLRNVAVILEGGALQQPVVAVTGTLGQYGFLNILGGSYTVSISSKRYTFTPSSLAFDLGSDVDTADFVAEPGSGIRPAAKAQLAASPW